MPGKAPPAKGTGGKLGRKVGPLPVWAWALLLLVLAYFFYKRNQGSASSSAGTSAATSAPADQQQGDASSGSSGAASSKYVGPYETITNNYNRIVKTAPKLHHHTFPAHKKKAKK